MQLKLLITYLYSAQLDPLDVKTNFENCLQLTLDKHIENVVTQLILLLLSNYLTCKPIFNMETQFGKPPIVTSYYFSLFWCEPY